jgi:hypothetical protein
MDTTLNIKTFSSMISQFHMTTIHIFTTTNTSNITPRGNSKQVICTKTIVIRDVKPCRLADRHQLFKEK